MLKQFLHSTFCILHSAFINPLLRLKSPPVQILASSSHAKAIHSTADLLVRLRIDAAFVGSVARSAWLGSVVERGPIDVLALMGPQQKNQVAMMASNRGFRVEREEIEQSEELDLVPLNFIDPEGDVRVHVLVGSNALYGRMVASAVEAQIDDRTLRVPAAEDLALLLGMSGDEEAVQRISALPGFDRRAYNDKLASIGLSHWVVAE